MKCLLTHPLPRFRPHHDGLSTIDTRTTGAGWRGPGRTGAGRGGLARAGADWRGAGADWRGPGRSR
ncbi:hypothetical protein, partial [Streptomyces beihaiensis]|nr:hypothetical protein [Streptomyces beihaiensis]